MEFLLFLNLFALLLVGLAIFYAKWPQEWNTMLRTARLTGYCCHRYNAITHKQNKLVSHFGAVGLLYVVIGLYLKTIVGYEQMNKKYLLPKGAKTNKMQSLQT